MFAKIVAIFVFVACAQAVEYGGHHATSYSSINRYDNHGGSQYAQPQANYQHAAQEVHKIAHIVPVTTHHQHAAPVATYHHAAPVATQHHSAYQQSAPVATYQHAAPVATYHHAAPVATYHHAAPVVYKSAPHHQEQYAHPKYSYKYGVNDHHTGDIKSQHEERDGDVVKGEYSLVQPDGITRTVHYTADKSGFNAQVAYSGHAAHPQQQHKAAAYHH